MRELFQRSDGSREVTRAYSRARRALVAGVALVLTPVALMAVGAFAQTEDETDPARNTPLPCELVDTPGMPARSAKNMTHLANRCGLVGTDIEFQSRKDASGKVHNFAFVGTMGAGFRIWDVTNPSNPRRAGGFVDSGWQNDIQVEGNVAVSTFDGVAGEDSTASTCLKTKYPEANGQGVDIFKLHFDRSTAEFDVTNPTCVANPPGGAHNATLHPQGKWLAISNPSSDWAVDIIDLRPFFNGNGDPRHVYRFIDESRQDTQSEKDMKCPADASFECVVMKRPDGSSASELWRPHDVSFSRNGETMYVAAINSTWIVNVSRVLEGRMPAISIIPNQDSEPGETSNDIAISHQADVSSDGKILVVSDEKGGGTSNTSCNTETEGQQVIGALHFYALAPLGGVNRSNGASPSNPKKLGIYVNPNPTFAADPLDGVGTLPRLERGCTVHVFRLGGNGTAGPGPIDPNFDGVSRLGSRSLTTAWYGAGTWQMNFAGKPSNRDGIREDDQTTWGNTKGWIAMPGADTWSAKEYKGHIYTGDMLRGFDVFKIE